MNLSSPGGNAEGNKPPVVMGQDSQTAQMGMPLKLSATASDDGIPKPRGGRGQGTQLRWEEYRGPGDAEFSTPTVTGECGKATEALLPLQFQQARNVLAARYRLRHPTRNHS